MAPPADVDDNIDDNVVVDDDNSSVVSDEFEDSELSQLTNPNRNNVNNVQNNRRCHLELLNLGPVPQLPRLRSGRV